MFRSCAIIIWTGCQPFCLGVEKGGNIGRYSRFLLPLSAYCHLIQLGFDKPLKSSNFVDLLMHLQHIQVIQSMHRIMNSLLQFHFKLH